MEENWAKGKGSGGRAMRGGKQAKKEEKYFWTAV